MEQPPITHKQPGILNYIYRYRFITRAQLQKLMHHTDKRRIGVWLKELREKHFIEWKYNAEHFIEKSKPALYYLGLNGIRYLRTTTTYAPSGLRKRYKETTRTPEFITRCLLIVDCCMTLVARSIQNVAYTYAVAADYDETTNYYSFLSELQPHLYFRKQETTPAGILTSHYVLELFSVSLPRYMLKRRMKDYIEYLATNEWQQSTNYKDSFFVLLTFPTTKELIYAKRFIRRLLEDMPDNELPIRLATHKKITQYGVTGNIWGDCLYHVD